jgi:hypothetical protein
MGEASPCQPELVAWQRKNGTRGATSRYLFTPCGPNYLCLTLACSPLACHRGWHLSWLIFEIKCQEDIFDEVEEDSGEEEEKGPEMSRLIGRNGVLLPFPSDEYVQLQRAQLHRHHFMDPWKKPALNAGYAENENLFFRYIRNLHGRNHARTKFSRL